MKFNMKGWKKHAQDADHTILKNADGHELRIAHKALRPEHRKELLSLTSEKMADGGEVDKKAPESSSSPKIDPKKAKEVQEGATESGFQPKKWLSNVKEGLGYADGGEVDDSASLVTPQADASTDQDAASSADQGPAIPVGSLPQVPTQGIESDPRDIKALENKVVAEKEPGLVPNAAQTVAAPLPGNQAQPADPYGLQAQQATTQEGLQQQEKGLTGQAKAEGEAATKAADLYKAKAKGEVSALSDIQKHYNDYQKEANAVIADLKGSTIDPNHYWNNKSVGSKIATVIGLMLGGFNPSGHNSALEYMKSQIHNDMEAQKANLGKKQSLFNALNQHYGNEQDASKMFLAIKNQGIIDQMEEAKAKATSPLAQATLDQNIGKLKLENAHTFADLATKKALLSSGQPAQGKGADAQIQERIQAMRVMNPGMAKDLEARYVPGMGLASIPLSGEIRSNITAKQTLDQRAKDLYQWSSRHSGSLDPGTIAEGKTKAAELQSLYRNAINGGVFKKGEQEFIDQIVDSDPTKFFNSIRVLPKLKEIISSNDSQLNTLKRSYGLPANESSTASEIKTINGVQYQKVSGGWKRI